MRFNWSIASQQPLLVEGLIRRLGVSPLLAQCLVNRGLSDPALAAAFLEPHLRDLEDPFRLPDMLAAVSRLLQARDRQEGVVIFGDYDVDGVTSTALLLEVLGSLGWRVAYYLPRRLEEGYGLSLDAVQNCLAQHPATLLVAVDCGSTATETIDWLAAQQIDTIVLDHHQVSHPPPRAAALVNPRNAPQPGGPAGHLCSAGLAFKLAHALVKEGRRQGRPAESHYDLRASLDSVAVGTIADLVPLTGENRILVAAGLRRLDTTRRPGLRALKAVAQTARPPGVYEVGFQLAPRLNAAGRLETASTALELLLTVEDSRAEALARELDLQNRERRKIEQTIAEAVIGAVRARFDPERDYVIVEGQLLWHIGVVGIVASRVLREFHRPALILGGDGEIWRGSGRSIEGFDLAAALRECDDLLLRHGGHAMAAGLSVKPENVEALRARLNALARRSLSPRDLQPRLRLDGEVPLRELTIERIQELARLAPCGEGNPPVRLAARNVTPRQSPRRMGKEAQHVRLSIADGPAAAEVVWWGAGDAPLPQERFDLAFEPELNDYNGRTSVQLRLLDWQPAGAAISP
jgi:single-stranded-DNA-specific exonuclease